MKVELIHGPLDGSELDTESWVTSMDISWHVTGTNGAVTDSRERRGFYIRRSENTTAEPVEPVPFDWAGETD